MENLIVPYDFGPAGQKALAYAKELASKQNSKITLLHIAENAEGLQQAETQFSQIRQDESGQVETKAVAGNLVNDLANEAIRANGSFVVMAVKSESGLQKIFGSTAIKVITESHIPFLIFQDKQEQTQSSGPKKIAITMDFNEESTQVLNAAVQLCENFGAKMVLVGGDNPDAKKKAKIDANISKMLGQLDTTAIEYEVVYLPTKDFEDGLVDYASKNGVDMLAVTYYKDNSALFSSDFVQHLLENKEGIPVLSIGGYEVPAFQKMMTNVVCPMSIVKIDSNISRTTVFLNVILMVIFMVTYNPIFAYIVAADYFIRASIGGKFSPIMYIAKAIIKPLNLKAKLIGLSQKVFASRLGFLCALAAVIFYHYDVYLGSMISMGMLAVLSFMDSVLNFCVGCVIYNYLVYPLFKFRSR